MNIFLLYVLVLSLVLPTTVNANDQVLSVQEQSEVTALYDQGKVALESGNPQRAIEYFQKAHQKAPDDYELNMAIGTLYFEIERPQEAVSYLEKAAKVGGDKLAPNLAAGVSNMILGNYDQAIAYFERASVIEPTNPMPYKEMGVCYFRKDDMARAKENFLKARTFYDQKGDSRAVQDVEMKLKTIEAKI